MIHHRNLLAYVASLALSWLSALVMANEPAASSLADPARRAAAQIRREAILPPHGPEGRPLPLVSHWNMGSQGRGWTPQYQLELLHQGHHILPWLGWPQGDPEEKAESARRFQDDYEELLGQCRQWQLPISFRGTQWEAILVGKEYRELPPDQCPAIVPPEGQAIAKLSPFGPVDRWRDPAQVYVDTPAMKRVQQLYPDPPLVLFVSNNEAPDLRWHQVESLSQRLSTLTTGATSATTGSGRRKSSR